MFLSQKDKQELKNTMTDSSKHFEEHPPDYSGYYYVFHAPYIACFSERLAKNLKILNIGVTFQKERTFLKLFMQT